MIRYKIKKITWLFIFISNFLNFDLVCINVIVFTAPSIIQHCNGIMIKVHKAQTFEQ
jgi:hypothetical protein